MKPFYQKHVFFCVNQKEAGKKCCQNANASQFFEYMKNQLQQRNLFGPGLIRVSHSGCLGRCALGPMMVVYPDNIWYSYRTFENIDAIIAQHLIGQVPVAGLQIDA